MQTGKLNKIDSSKFDIKRMLSGIINNNFPEELGSSLAPYLDRLIHSLPEDEEIYEPFIRSVVDILVISKLQSEKTRENLDRAKDLLENNLNTILNSKLAKVGRLHSMNIDQWTIISLNETINSPIALIDNISEIIDRHNLNKHLILDLSRLECLDIHLSAYLIGLQSMLQSSNRQVSICWLPGASTTGVSNSLRDSFISKFRLYKKGAFLLSQENQAADF